MTCPRTALTIDILQPVPSEPVAAKVVLLQARHDGEPARAAGKERFKLQACRLPGCGCTVASAFESNNGRGYRRNAEPGGEQLSLQIAAA